MINELNLTGIPNRKVFGKDKYTLAYEQETFASKQLNICSNIYKWMPTSVWAKSNNIEFDEEYHIDSNIEALDKVIYKEIINNLDNIGLTETEEKAFKMYYVEDLSIKEISKRLSSKETNIKYFLYNARNKIKERYT